MSPPTEQLIRDYISRLSVAAQGRLNRKDRLALMDRTRRYIEHITGLSGPATALDVAGVLSRLGDPALVVAHEVQRLAEIRGDAGEPPPAARIRRLARASRREPGRLGASWHWPARPGNLADLRAVLTGGRAGAAGPNAAPGETDVGARDATERGAGAGDELAETTGTQTAGAVAPAPVSGLEALGLAGRRQDDAGAAQADPRNAGPGGLAPAGPATLAGLIPAQAGESASLKGTLPEAVAPGRFAGAGRPGAAGPQRPLWPHDPAIRRDAAEPGRAGQDADDQGAVEADDQAAVVRAETDELAVVSAVGFAAETAEEPVVAGPKPEAGPDAGPSDSRDGADARAESDVTGLSADGTGELPAADLTDVETEATEAPRLARIRRAWAAVVGWTREKTLESVATILLGLGGAIFPPIWLLGAMVALASKVWDYRDKWVGLAVPIVLTIVGTAAGLILTGSQSSFGHDLHVAWVSANVASRVSAALGATYLAWRSVHGRRPDAVPPWNKQHRVG